MRTKALKVTTEELQKVEDEKNKLEEEKMIKLQKLFVFKGEGIIDENEYKNLRKEIIDGLISSK